MSDAGTSKKSSSLSSIESSEHITVVKPQPVEVKTETDTSMGDAVQASITRQISVSRDQRSMLGSIRGRPQNRKGSVPVHIEDIRMGHNERLVVESKKQMPTLVVPDSAGSDGPRSFHRHRKSERAVVEGV